MGALVTATLVCTLLDPAFLLTQHLQDLPPEEPGLNLSFDPWTMTLTWDCIANSTDIKCGMSSGKRGPVTIRPRGPQCRCAFSKAVLHGGAVFTVTAQVGPRRVTERLSFTNAGEPGTAAQNVSCLVYKADFMNCTWAKGPAAPENVQYFLHIRDLGSGRTRGCPRYLGDPGAAHTGCHLQGASAFGSEIYVLVNGTSPGGGGIQFYDATLMMKRIEVYDPPGNITVDCNSSHCLVRWDTPAIRLFLSNSEMHYQLDVHRQNRMQPSDHQLVDIAGGPRNIHIFLKPLPRGKHMARMRAADSRLLHWGPWSRAVEFGSEEWAPGQLLALLAVLGTVVCVLIALFLFNRFVGAPVPGVRDKLNTTDDEIIWDKFTPDDGKGDPEDVFHVEETEIGKPSAKV